ncbi:MAG: flagellar basal body P-ring protein FlgI [Alphaproteobacteria bacterium]|jgi:flagellar P-ring protein precursor FlgI|nr:flagellar basal body P-ring protein FlgI [Alphaproteobacteria bacterium]MCB1550772.1 flagellar basal body P-ring protein FlgI [Alphaproteobacteria bacterium]MCB9984387.1 flagellar basal body P-ring protein FlgI [Micavibrio sp.]HRK97847.1 flagellar basal body P-ring protein FlgI [Alphaproteobacteria bacterium]
MTTGKMKMVQRLSVLLSFLWLAAVFFVSVSTQAQAATARIKDIVNIEGVRDNVLIGYGLVVGLNGTGDKLNNSPFTQQSLIAMLERLGVNVKGENLNTGNVAAVMVTSTMPPFQTQGSRIDVTVSTLGDAKNLQGGTLLVTPLMGADGEVYAVSQGPVAISGFSASGEAQTVTQNTPTRGRIADGAIVEREIKFDLNELPELKLALKNPDFTTARRIAQAINGYTSAELAYASNDATVTLRKSSNYPGTMVDLITDIEQLPIQPDQVARVVIDENSGTIVMGSEVRVSTVAIAQGSLTIKVSETPQVSQPNPFSENGETVVVPRSDIEVNQSADAKLAILESGVTLQDLVTGLNKLGVGPRDIITILQAIKAAGALQAEIETM